MLDLADSIRGESGGENQALAIVLRCVADTEDCLFGAYTVNRLGMLTHIGVQYSTPKHTYVAFGTRNVSAGEEDVP